MPIIPAVGSSGAVFSIVLADDHAVSGDTTRGVLVRYTLDHELIER